MRTLALILTAVCFLTLVSAAEARPRLPAKAASVVGEFVGNRLEGVQRRHHRRAERRQSGHRLAHILRCN